MPAPDRLRIGIELGAKRVFASALDYPGWARSARTEEAALEALVQYAPRYALIAARAGVELPTDFALDVIERVPGNGTTDFGAPDRAFAVEDDTRPAAEARRLQAMGDAGWAAFTEVSSAAPEQLRKGPRGGGRDRSEVIEHVQGADAMGLARRAWGDRYRARRRAWHLTDHLWEIQDRSA